MRTAFARSVSLGLAAAAMGQGGSVVVVAPDSCADVEGNTGGVLPFSQSGTTRYQQAFGPGSLSAIAGKSISVIAFRLDGSQTQDYPGGFDIPNLTIRLSITPMAIDQLSTDLDSNMGPLPVTVFSGPYTIPTLCAGPAPHPFDLQIILPQPYLYTGGVLLMDVQGGMGPASGFMLDDEATLGDAVCRAYAPLSGSPVTDTTGLVTQFTALPGPCYPNCDNSTVPPILNVNDFVCFLSKMAFNDPYANCDGSTTPPVLNVLDFTCFLNRFVAGCS